MVFFHDGDLMATARRFTFVAAAGAEIPIVGA
jgi:hypothetical protein